MNNDLEKKLNNNLIYGILLAIFASITFGATIIILNEFKLKPAVKNNNIKDIEFTQKIIKILIIISCIVALINLLVKVIALVGN